MKIGELARVTGIKAETIRYYEKIGLLDAPGRTTGNYRTYGADDRQLLTFIRNARELGFEMSQIRSLIDLAKRIGPAPGDAQIVSAHLTNVEAKLILLDRLRAELSRFSSEAGNREDAGGQIIRALICDDAHDDDAHDPS